MSVHYTIPKGPLVSFGSFNFHVGRSILQGDWSIETSAEAIALAGYPQEVDLAGLATLSMHGTYTWQYDIIPQGGSVAAVQDELTTLLTGLHTPNMDGTTGQVALLTVKLLGYPSTNATAMARLVKVASLETYSVRAKVGLTFMCPSFFTYTA